MHWIGAEKCAEVDSATAVVSCFSCCSLSLFFVFNSHTIAYQQHSVKLEVCNSRWHRSDLTSLRCEWIYHWSHRVNFPVKCRLARDMSLVWEVINLPVTNAMTRVPPGLCQSNATATVQTLPRRRFESCNDEILRD